MEYVRTRREKLGITQEELAVACFCDATTISQIEHRRMTPRLRLFRYLTRALKCSPKRLMNELLEDEPVTEGEALVRAVVTDLQKAREQRREGRS